MSEEKIENFKRKEIKLIAFIQGLDTIVLKVEERISQKHYEEIIKEYYDNIIYGGNPTGKLHLFKAIKFVNGDYILHFKRQDSLYTSILAYSSST